MNFGVPTIWHREVWKAAKARTKFMGYRSDVLMAGKMPTALLKKHVALLALTQPWFKFIEEEIERETFAIDLKQGMFLYEEAGVKFYESFQYVQALLSFYQYFEELSEPRVHDSKEYQRITKDLAPEDNVYDIDLLFIRIGEDSDDIENKYVNMGYDLGYTKTVIRPYCGRVENTYGCGNYDDKCKGEAGDQIPVLRGTGDADEDDSARSNSNSADRREEHLLQPEVDQQP